MLSAINAFGLLFFFVLGAIVGSFLNVVIFRYGTGRSVNGRSACLSCASKLKWHQMVPILSYLALRGRCASCGTKISKQYVFVELLTAVLFTALAHLHFILLELGYVEIFMVSFIFYAVITCCAVVIFVYDMKHMIIPDACVYTWIVFGLLWQGIGFFMLGIDKILFMNLAAGPILFIFFWALWYFSKGTWMGFGDAKLGLAIGLTLGLSKGITAIVLGFWIGAIVGIILLALSKSKHIGRRYSLKSEVPFGPFLIIGFFLALLLNLDLVWMSHLFSF